eukprot:m.109556 g.109556  ORF g.109556 m.109556 type:complete len:218 (+) comp9202_c0_seq1:252-905(+)
MWNKVDQYVGTMTKISNVLIINAASPVPGFCGGKYNLTMAEKAEEVLKEKGCEVKHTTISDGYEVSDEVEKMVWADLIIFQSPVYWMGVPWIAKKYMDEVLSAGMYGKLGTGDGRTREDPSKQYGTGGVTNGKKYMISLTFNAPEAAFNDKSQYLFEGKSVDDLWFPLHMNFRFFDMRPLDTFSVHDIMHLPDIERDLKAYETHLNKVWESVEAEQK